MRRTLGLVLLAVLAAPTADTLAADRLLIRVTAVDARVNRLVTGEVVEWVQDVPAEPVDSFVWDGVGSVEVEGAVAMLEIDPVDDTGFIVARWTDEHGSWEYTQFEYTPPPHPAGLRFGPSLETIAFVAPGTDPVTTDVYLHGDTSAGEAVLPTMFSLLATWGPGEVTLDGVPFDNIYDGPVPKWVGHTMTSVGVRGDDGTVRTTEGDIYDFSKASAGAADFDDREFHLVFHDRHGPVTTNLPADFSFFYHLVFEDVKIEVLHGDE